MTHCSQPSIGHPHFSHGCPGSWRARNSDGLAWRAAWHPAHISTVNRPSTSWNGPVEVPQNEQRGLIAPPQLELLFDNGSVRSQGEPHGRLRIMVADVRMTLQTAEILNVLLAKPLKPRGTLYPALARLEQAGWVASEWEDIDEAAEGRRRRRYYRLTGEGIVAAQKALEAVAQRLHPGWLPTPGPTMGGAEA